jgi:hypothetical protein
VAVWGYAELVEEEGHLAALLAGEAAAVAACLAEIDAADRGDRPARRSTQSRPSGL